ncbi:hypothetical protein GNP61_19440 [Aliivibrio fischeri]|uniref:hypothetical protein n=1 Tax=Aliivibrio fischeri TaxID=668 RepID=UPI0012DAF70F|nr:hypothetical protein [Aliivibrio fischeri]MUK43721.1 hypothetical protein [Aliivibrio fischeri]
MTKELDDFRLLIDSDGGLQTKRKLLTTLCVVFLSLNLSGATLEEANTFLFKIKFSNYIGLSYLFLAAILFLTLRYYSYAQNYHKKLYDFWTQRLLSSHQVFYFDPHHAEFGGLVGEAITVFGYDDLGVLKPNYCITGIFKRSISYKTSGIDDERGQYFYSEYISLCKFNEKWRLSNYIMLLWYEFKYQVEATFKYRESLDLLAPYLLSMIAILSFVFKTEILSLM